MKRVKIYQLNDFWTRTYLCDVVKITDKMCYMYQQVNGKNQLKHSINITNYISIKIEEIK